jgi:hypothetical protein
MASSNEVTIVGPLPEDQVRQKGFFNLQRMLGGAAEALLDFPRRPNGTPMLLRQSFFERLLSGDMELSSFPAGDVLAAQVDVRHLTLPQLLRIRCGVTALPRMQVQSKFMACVEDGIERLVAEQLARGSMSFGPSDMTDIARLVLFTYGVHEHIAASDGPKSSNQWLLRHGQVAAVLCLETCELRNLQDDAVGPTFCHRSLSKASQRCRMLHWEVELSENPKDFDNAAPNRRPQRAREGMKSLPRLTQSASDGSINQVWDVDAAMSGAIHEAAACVEQSSVVDATEADAVPEVAPSMPLDSGEDVVATLDQSAACHEMSAASLTVDEHTTCNARALLPETDSSAGPNFFTARDTLIADLFEPSSADAQRLSGLTATGPWEPSICVYDDADDTSSTCSTPRSEGADEESTAAGASSSRADGASQADAAWTPSDDAALEEDCTVADILQVSQPAMTPLSPGSYVATLEVARFADSREREICALREQLAASERDRKRLEREIEVAHAFNSSVHRMEELVEFDSSTTLAELGESCPEAFHPVAKVELITVGTSFLLNCSKDSKREAKGGKKASSVSKLAKGLLRMPSKLLKSGTVSKVRSSEPSAKDAQAAI